MNAVILLADTSAKEAAFPAGYLLGAIIALFLLGYLVYSLVKPEKF